MPQTTGECGFLHPVASLIFRKYEGFSEKINSNTHLVTKPKKTTLYLQNLQKIAGNSWVISIKHRKILYKRHRENADGRSNCLVLQPNKSCRKTCHHSKEASSWHFQEPTEHHLQQPSR
ncbi:hypothetical protein AVEN_102922-1 [Araneus ventricosus]|uniref:Uncharacterized protein n=1 Tax=Araneus ventricosus TaxID=182803 RepID=A0A4Y2V558_ARAVE|nr:hypothetical protein AVEN_102922-1 [Araneus ventricosus]